MAKDVQFGDVSSKIIKGVDVLANAVLVTLGPKRTKRNFTTIVLSPPMLLKTV